MFAGFQQQSQTAPVVAAVFDEDLGARSWTFVSFQIHDALQPWPLVLTLSNMRLLLVSRILTLNRFYKLQKGSIKEVKKREGKQESRGLEGQQNNSNNMQDGHRC